MSDPSKKETVAQFRGVIATALWIGMTAEEIKAVVTTLLIEATDA